MEKIPDPKQLLRPLLVSVLFFLVAVLVKAVFYLLHAEGIAAPQIFAFGAKAFTLFITLGALLMLRWVIVDAPFSLLRKYTITPLLKTIITLLLYFTAAIILLHRLFEINLMPLLTGSAVLTGIIALSLQETIRNLFTGLWINMERVVAKGDWVRVADKEGMVAEVTWRTTRLLTRGNDYIYLPNRVLAEGVLENYTYPSPQHVLELDINAGFNEAPGRMKDLLLEIASRNSSVLAEPIPEVWVLNFGEYAINYRLRVYINDFLNAPTIKSELYRHIWYAFRRNNVNIPFPVRTVYGRIGERPSEKPPSEDFILGALRSVDFLGVLKEEELRKVAASARVEVFSEGEPIVTQGEVGDTCYFIQKGSADVMFSGIEGREEFIAALKAGDFFGEMSLFAGEPRNASVVAKEDTVCVVIGHRAFQSVFNENPDIAEHLSLLLAKRSGELELIRSKAVSKNDAEKVVQKNIMAKIKKFFNIG